ncbi:Piso0_005175 [Millerozyma farinosa CBS 7064]|uniref:Mediator of RNA polymerase II transcription subunit 12 n=1 Tax=Pichia sorbitophila (strain ATCC MYA-4447 / BCRC 22081 / CBS 7064 / NBRC 10061 / NRRL Y-12695) TaxID=559304 RepID=G8Y4F0_PICSO|nr:Piso0_005175 [Millerozyma farinosa CBS 7064]
MRSRNSSSLPSTENSKENEYKKDLLSMKYQLEVPDVQIYPLNKIDNIEDTYDEIKHDNLTKEKSNLTYPDFVPWLDHTQLKKEASEAEVEALNNSTYLNRGYYETPSVSNEYYSARNVVQPALFESNNCENILNEMSQHLINAYKERQEVINKIKFDSNKFKLPQRVTLTASKREAWFRDLSSPDIPLEKISSKLPHGVKNKVLIEMLCNKSVPMSRALWFTRCILYHEIVSVRKKYHFKQYSVQSLTLQDSLEHRWLCEWTGQCSEYIYRFSKEMGNISTPERKSGYLGKLNYLLSYMSVLYMERLIDRESFISSFLSYMKESLPLEGDYIPTLVSLLKTDSNSVLAKWISRLDINFGYTLVGLALVKTFWNEILKIDHLSKKLAEALLLNHFFLKQTYPLSPKTQKPTSPRKFVMSTEIKKQILSSLSDMISYLFKYNNNAFVIPTYWLIVKDTLNNILLDDRKTQLNIGEKEETKKQTNLINYRNESLMLNMRCEHPTRSANDFNSVSDNSNEKETQEGSSTLINSKIYEELSLSDDGGLIRRSNDDILSIIEQLDRLKLGSNISDMIKPVPLAAQIEKQSLWRISLKILIHWAITAYRPKSTSSENILILCNFIKRNTGRNNTVKGSSKFKMKIENEILDIIYEIAEANDRIVNSNFYVLINELYQLKLITISGYLRKLIASGVFYLSTEEEKSSEMKLNAQIRMHLSILENLPVLNNRQCDSILKKWTSNNYDFKVKLEDSKEILAKKVLEKMKNNSFEDESFKVFEPIENLEVGLKYLLVNWFTNELKNFINSSSRLIHISTNTVSWLYHFFSICDNLAVFFKVVLRLILKNEGKVIVFYMDSLYLMSKLMVRHFDLLKYLPGMLSSTTTLELSELIVINYKDLLSRDTDCYNFKKIWKFIDSAIENDELKLKEEAEVVADDVVDNRDTSNDLGIADSSYYSEQNFKKDIISFIVEPDNIVNNSEIDDLLDSLNPKLKELITSYEGSKEAIQWLIGSYYKVINNDDGIAEAQYLKILRVCSKLLMKEDQLDGQKAIFSGIIKIFDDSAFDKSKALLLLKKLLITEAYDVSDALKFIKEELNVSEEEKLAMRYELAFGDSQCVQENLLSPSEKITLSCVHEDYIKSNYKALFTFLLEDMGSENDDIFASKPFMEYIDEILDLFKKVIPLHTKFSSDKLSKFMRREQIILLFNKMLFINDEPIISLKDIPRLSSIVDEFNLPYVQLLIKNIIENLENRNDNETTENLKSIIEKFLNNVKTKFSMDNAYFGELFAYAPWDYQLKIFNILEDMVLLRTTFPQDEKDEKEPGDKCNVALSSETGHNLLPLINASFKKFSLSQVFTVPTSLGFFHKLSKFSSKILNLATSERSFDKDFDADFYNMVSIYLRIIIIHKTTLASKLVEVDPQMSFIKGLVSLFNSNFFNESHEKLKILLYDLLLLLKSLVISSYSNESEGNLLETLPTPNIAASATTYQSPADETNASKNGNSPSAGSKEAFVDRKGLYANAPRHMASNLSLIGHLQQPLCINTLKVYINPSSVENVLTIGENEFIKNSDIQVVNDPNLCLVPSRRAAAYNDFSILGDSSKEKVQPKRFRLRSYELLEDTSSHLNDGCISLSIFDAFVSRENIP